MRRAGHRERGEAARPRALLSLVEAVAANVTGTRLHFEVGGRQLSFVLDRLRAERLSGPGDALQVEASELTVAGVRVERARALVPALRIEGGTRPHVVSDRIQLELHVTREALAEWMRHALPAA